MTGKKKREEKTGERITGERKWEQINLTKNKHKPKEQKRKEEEEKAEEE